MSAAAISSPPALPVVRIVLQIEALSQHPLSSDRRPRQGHNCEEPASNGYGGYTSFCHIVCRWMYSTARAIYYRESIFRWYVKDSLLYAPFQKVINMRRICHQAPWIVTWCPCPRFGLQDKLISDLSTMILARPNMFRQGCMPPGKVPHTTAGRPLLLFSSHLWAAGPWNPLFLIL